MRKYLVWSAIILVGFAGYVHPVTLNEVSEQANQAPAGATIVPAKTEDEHSNEIPVRFRSVNRQLTEIDKRLLEAVNSIDVDGVKKALSQGANPNASYSYSTAIGLPCEIGKKNEDEGKCVEIMEILLSAGATITQRDASSYMYSAIRNNQSRVIGFLLNNGVNPNGTFYGTETYMELAQKHARQEIVHILYAHGAKSISHQEALQLQLNYAVDLGTLEDVHKAVKNGASPRLSTRLKKTALIELLQDSFHREGYDLYGKVSYLLQEGADVNFVGKSINQRIPYTALAMSVVFLPIRLDPDDYRYEMILNALIKAGADVSFAGPDGQKNTPLHLAVSEKNIIAVEMLLHAGADASVCNEYASPIHYAVGHLPILKMLITSGADLSVRSNGTGITPLHLAASGNHYTAAELLLKGGAKITVEDKNGKTPLDYAESAEMIELLKSHVAKEQ